MAAPVWSLFVDLTTRTASFQSGLADAAKAARSSFGDIKESARDMGSSVGGSTRMMGGHMMEARHGVMMLGEEFGVHLPRGITTFIASLGPVGAAMEAAFPFLAIILGATLLIEHFTKLKSKADELTASQSKSAEDITEIFEKLDNKLLQVGIRTDELAGNHIAALRKQLELVDHQTLANIISEIDKMGKDADAVFSKMQSNWFMQLLMGRADVGPGQGRVAEHGG